MDDENIDILELDEKTRQMQVVDNSDSSSSKDNSILDNDTQDLKIVEVKKTSKEEKNSNKSKVVIVRYMLCSALLIICLGVSLLLYNQTRNNSAQYTVNSTVNYQVCLKKNDYYKAKCLSEGVEYLTSLTDVIRADFNYTEVYQEKVHKEYQYYIKSSIVIRTSEDGGKELYKKNSKLTKIESSVIDGNVVNIVESVDIPFPKNNTHAQKYINDYSLIGKGNLIVSLIIKDGKEEKEVSSLDIPLTQLTYNITKNELNNSVNKYKVESNNLPKNVFLALTIILGIITLIVAYKMLDYIINNKDTSSKYQHELKKILDIYDKVIVTLTDTTTIVNENEIYNVQTFLELLDVRDTVDKPILYHKVSDIETEFYVQDVDKTYLFKMKESDFINK